jgi:hypothetical protein
MALATLVPFKGPKKSRFLGPPPPLKCPSLWVFPPQNHKRYINRYTRPNRAALSDLFKLELVSDTQILDELLTDVPYHWFLEDKGISRRTIGVALSNCTLSIPR